MERPDIERLFAAGGLQHPCDLDLVLFFRRHPDTLITSEQLAKFVGHDLRQVGRSLDALVARRVVLRSPNPTHAARRYRLAPVAQREWLHRLFHIADGVMRRRCRLRGRSAVPEQLPEVATAFECGRDVEQAVQPLALGYGCQPVPPRRVGRVR